MTHPTKILATHDPKELAKQLSNLRYDKLAEFLQHLADKLENDWLADMKRGRGKLADQLHIAHCNLQEAHRCIAKAWEICEPFEVPKA